MSTIRNFCAGVGAVAVVLALLYKYGAERPGDLNDRWASYQGSAILVALATFALAIVLHFLICLYEAGIQEGRRREIAKVGARNAELREERQLIALGLLPGGCRISRR
ncbi:hypothetical protein A3A71_02325 [Candidatus Berkelbacteria bacterium RIFCSPLOWO2_01_FULL_50_28]|uniref:Uncharacterized protein n=1 Tax=Candidatus Berkelbacteria bacterium RIFCSPLOWO2_01_FULL_50_28 TaxID=1797471 RepID=A0A1F5EC39_9BACT|nr:MAG: hypothetical protein A2807_00720 [Candidatus Berkelbacteria bacterium RIFCSPHIGHO2_01_FULL_50_36]OGD64860.1 MAG: hypothetical protein A3A71_02325 [Candidatus Berkelbacteria bacterium RIFCSPLOWO2_01_FULL_50_28]